MRTGHVFSIFVLLSLAMPGQAEQTVVITQAWISEAPPTAKVNAGYFSIENRTAETLRLLRVSSTDYARIEIHRNRIVADTVKMEALQSLSIAAQEKRVFRPGGYHLMLFEPAKYFQQGESIVLQFAFSNGAVIPVRAEVRKLDGRHHHHHVHH